jgi:VRR-NUC domain.
MTKLTPEQQQYRLVPERAVQKAVEDMLTLYGWKFFHAPDNKPSAGTGRVQKIVPGFPDIIAIRGTRIIVIENKKELEQPREDQEEWLRAFKATGKVETYVIRPSTMRWLAEQLKPEWAKQ